MEMSVSVALRYILELLKAGDRHAAMRELERMIPQAVAWEQEMRQFAAMDRRHNQGEMTWQ